MSLNTIETHFKESQLVLKEFSTEENFRKIQAAGEALASALKNDKKLSVVEMEGLCVMLCILPRNLVEDIEKTEKHYPLLLFQIRPIFLV